MSDEAPIPYFYREAELLARLRISRSSLRAKIDPKSVWHDPSFPRPVKLGIRTIAWHVEQIEAWILALAGPALH